jgi:hypothetical protein
MGAVHAENLQDDYLRPDLGHLEHPSAEVELFTGKSDISLVAIFGRYGKLKIRQLSADDWRLRGMNAIDG